MNSNFDLVQIKRVSCPVCESCSLVPCDYERKYFLRAFEREVLITYGVCKSCGFITQLNPLNEDGLGDYYRSSLQFRTTQVSRIEEMVFSQQERFIFEGGGERRFKNLLEIGPDTGQFLSFLEGQRSGHLKTYYFELSEEAKKHLRETGSQDLEELGPEQYNFFDIIVLRHVLEHVFDPASMLNFCSERLVSGGAVFIEVPDYGVIDAQTDPLSFEHLSYFSIDTLLVLLQRAGFTIVRSDTAINEGYPTTEKRVLRILAVRKSATDRSLADLVSSHAKSSTEPHIASINRILESSPGRLVAIYGAGWRTEDALLNGKLDKDKLVGIFDKDDRKQGTKFHGVEVHAPKEIAKLKPDTIVILSSYEREVRDSLRESNFAGKVIGWSELPALGE